MSAITFATTESFVVWRPGESSDWIVPEPLSEDRVGADRDLVEVDHPRPTRSSQKSDHMHLCVRRQAGVARTDTYYGARCATILAWRLGYNEANGGSFCGEPGEKVRCECGFCLRNPCQACTARLLRPRWAQNVRRGWLWPPRHQCRR